MKSSPFIFSSLWCTKYTKMPWIDSCTTSLWIDHALTESNLQKHQCIFSLFFVDCLEAPLALKVFAGAFSCTLHCKALWGLLILLLSLQRQPGIDRIMGLNDTLGHLSEEGRLLAPNTHPVEMSQFTSVSVSASVFGFVLFCVRQKWMPF